MSRYIDADALMEQLWDAETRIGYVQVVDAQTIIDAPTADVVHVIRCKDCKYWQKDLFGNRWCKGIERKNCDWFCADGEKVTE